jgi:hypothetical protein
MLLYMGATSSYMEVSCDVRAWQVAIDNIAFSPKSDTNFFLSSITILLSSYMKVVSCFPLSPKRLASVPAIY